MKRSHAPLPTAHADALARALVRHVGTDGALLPLLHDIQTALGWIPAACVPHIAEALHLSRAEVHGVISYYHDFRDSPPPAHRLRVCQAESCQACGSEALMTHCEALLGCRAGSGTNDGQWVLEPVYCLGLCAQSPSIELDGQLYARTTPQHVQQLLEAVPAQAAAAHTEASA